MKISILTAFLILRLAVSNFAADDFTGKTGVTISHTVQAKFAKKFAEAEAVTWQVTEKFQKAYFTLNGLPMTAFYNLKDEYVATTHLIHYTKLPVVALNRIGKRYRGYMIKSVIQYTGTETVYFVNLIKANKEVLVRVMLDSNIYLFKKLT